MKFNFNYKYQKRNISVNSFNNSNSNYHKKSYLNNYSKQLVFIKKSLYKKTYFIKKKICFFERKKEK